MITTDCDFYDISEIVSSKNSQKSEMERLAEAQARKIVKECLQKKFGGTASQMQSWLLGKPVKNGQNVDRWSTEDPKKKRAQVPAWALMRIFTELPEFRAFAFEGLEVAEADPAVAALRQRIDNLLHDAVLLEHFKSVVVICEGFLRHSTEARTAAQLMQASRHLSDSQRLTFVKELLHDVPEGYRILREITADPQQDDPGTNRQNQPRPAGPDPKGKTPAGKK